MVFSERDIDVLRLLCWCQYIRPEDVNGIVERYEIDLLIKLGLIKLHEKSGALILTGNGKSFLHRLFHDTPNTTLPYDPPMIERRLRTSRLTLTAYRAGFQVFTVSPEDLISSPSFFLTSVARGKGANPWGSTRIAALAHMGDLLCSMHYVCTGIGKIALTNELAAFSNQTAQFRKMRRALVFAGESYGDVLSELESMTAEPNAKRIYYGDAYRCVRLPIHLLSCDDTGAMQLQLMAVPEYRQRLARAALQGDYEPPPGNAAAWDAIYRGMPFVLAVDMDLRRIDAALELAGMADCTKIAIAALPGQVDALLSSRYRETGRARVFDLTDRALEEVLGYPPSLYSLGKTQYFTQKGAVVDAAFIQAGRKAGGHR